MSLKPIAITSHDLQVPKGRKAIPANEYLHYEKANQIISEARRRAEQIIADAEKVYESEKSRGFDEGLMESRVEQSEQMLKMVGRSINYLAEVEHTMAEILMSAVKKIIDDFDDRKLTVGLIKSALQHVRNERQVTVRVPPAHYAFVKDKVAEILAGYKGVGFVNPVSDPRLRSGSCILESKIGVVDASVDVQLEALKRRFEKLSAQTIQALKKDDMDVDDTVVPEPEVVVETSKMPEQKAGNGENEIPKNEMGEDVDYEFLADQPMSEASEQDDASTSN